MTPLEFISSEDLTNLDIDMPVKGTFISGFDRPRSGGARLHRAGDIAAPAGTPVVAPDDMEFVAGGQGGTNLKSNDWWSWWKNPDTGKEYRFAHHGPIQFQPGEKVSRGQQWGEVGNVINGPHIHMAVREGGQPIDWAGRMGLEQGRQTDNSLLARIGNFIGPSSAEAAEPKGQLQFVGEGDLTKGGGKLQFVGEGDLTQIPEQAPYAGFEGPVYPGKPLPGPMTDPTRGHWERDISGLAESGMMEEYKWRNEPTATPKYSPEELKQRQLEADIEEGRAGADTLAQFGGKAFQPEWLTFPVDWAVNQLGKRTLRPLLEYTFPKKEKLSEEQYQNEMDMAEHGLEALVSLNLYPSYFKALNAGADTLIAAGQKYAPNAIFKYGGMGDPNINLPAPKPLTEAQMARMNEFTKARLMGARATGEAPMTPEEPMARAPVREPEILPVAPEVPPERVPSVVPVPEPRKVIPAKGEVIYHGSPQFIGDVVNLTSKSIRTKLPDMGMFFTSDLTLAQQYAGDTGEVIKGTLNAKNPKIIDAQGTSINNYVPEQIELAKEQGHDVLIIKNTIDQPEPTLAGKGIKNDVTIVLDKDAVKIDKKLKTAKDILSETEPTPTPAKEPEVTLTPDQEFRQKFGTARGKQPEGLLTKPRTYDLVRAEERNDLKTFIKALGPIRPDSVSLRNLAPEERKAAFPLLDKKGKGMDEIFEILKREYPHIAGQFKDEHDFLKAAINNKPLDMDRVIKEHYANEEELAARAQFEGITPEALADIEADVEKEIASQESLVPTETPKWKGNILEWSAPKTKNVPKTGAARQNRFETFKGTIKTGEIDDTLTLTEKARNNWEKNKDPALGYVNMRGLKEEDVRSIISAVRRGEATVSVDRMGKLAFYKLNPAPKITDIPPISPEALKVKKQFPDISDAQAEVLAQDPALQQRFAKGDWDAIDQVYRASRVSDAGAQEPLPGMPPPKGTLFYGGIPGPEAVRSMVQTANKVGAAALNRIFGTKDKAWEEFKGKWLGERELAKFRSRIRQMDYQDAIQAVASEKRIGPETKRLDELIHLYMDEKRDPEGLARVWEKLTPEQQTKALEAKTILLKHPELEPVLVKMREDMDALKERALDAKVIRTVIENHVNRVWDLPKEGPGLEAARKFGTTTRHAKQRVFPTIFDGWANGYNLLIKGASNNLRILEDELNQAIADKAMLARGLKKGWEGGKFSQKHLEGYDVINHPNFKNWKWVGKIEADPVIATVRQMSQTIKKTVTSTETVAGEEAARVSDSKPIQHMKEIVRNSLVQRGMTEGEANAYINRIETSAINAAKGKPEEPEVEKGEATAKIIRELEEKIVTIEEKEKVISHTIRAKYFGRRDLWIDPEGNMYRREDVFAPEVVAKNLNTMLGKSPLYDIPMVSSISKFNAMGKKMILTLSLFHPRAFMLSYMAGSQLPIREMNPITAYKMGMEAIRARDPRVESLVKNGMTLWLRQDYEDPAYLMPTKLGQKINKIPVAGAIKLKMEDVGERAGQWIFDRLGASLKTDWALKHYDYLKAKYPDMSDQEIARQVAYAANNNFGGLNLMRIGRKPVVQHLMRMGLLAPDWTESNLKAFVDALDPRADQAFKKAFFKKFWAKVMARIASVVIVGNIIMSAFDDKSNIERFKTAWRLGNLRWLDVDVTPLVRLWNDDKAYRHYFRVGGHMLDPLRLIDNPIKFFDNKGSILTRFFEQAFTGTDWKGDPFTTVDELMGFADPLLRGQFTKAGKGGLLKPKQVPSFLGSQARGLLPIPAQNLIGYWQGETNSYLAVTKTMGALTSSGKEKSEVEKAMMEYQMQRTTNPKAVAAKKYERKALDLFDQGKDAEANKILDEAEAKGIMPKSKTDKIGERATIPKLVRSYTAITDIDEQVRIFEMATEKEKDVLEPILDKRLENLWSSKRKTKQKTKEDREHYLKIKEHFEGATQ